MNNVIDARHRFNPEKDWPYWQKQIHQAIKINCEQTAKKLLEMEKAFIEEKRSLGLLEIEK
jgi:hypothetical protein